jgi:hypothetical protein
MKNMKLSLITFVAFSGLMSIGALADTGTTAPQQPMPTPTKTMNPEQRINGRCHFWGNFTDGKSKDTGSSINCRARLRFDRDDLKNRPKDERERRRFFLECDGQEIYDDGLRVIPRGDGDHDEDDETVIFKGKRFDDGVPPPKIIARDVDINERQDQDDQDDQDDEFRERSPATLIFSSNGFLFELPGACRFNKVHEEKP